MIIFFRDLNWQDMGKIHLCLVLLADTIFSVLIVDNQYTKYLNK